MKRPLTPSATSSRASSSWRTSRAREATGRTLPDGPARARSSRRLAERPGRHRRGIPTAGRESDATRAWSDLLHAAQHAQGLEQRAGLVGEREHNARLVGHGDAKTLAADHEK